MKRAEKINILFVNPSYKPYLGGTERVIEQLSKEYAKFGDIGRVGVLTTFMDFNYSPPRENPSLPAMEVMDGLEVYRLRFVPQRLRFFYSLPAGLFSLKIKRVMDDFRPHIIHFLLSEWFVANAWIRFMTRRSCRHVLLISFHEPPEALRYLPMKHFMTHLGRAVDRIHVSSDHVKKRVVSYYRLPPEKIDMIPLGLTSSADTRPAEKKPSNGAVSLLAVGRLSHDKGQLELVRIFHKVRPKLSKRVKLILAGGNGGQREDIERYIRQNGLDDDVVLKGFVPDNELHELYKDADIFVLLTRIESFGLVFAEAQSYGLPVIGYRIGPLEALFGRGSMLVEPFKDAQVGNAIQQLVEDGAFRDRLGREARDHAWTNFSWEKTARDFVGMYRKVIAAGA